MTPKTQKIIGWVLAGLLTAFQLLTASGKLFAQEGSEMATGLQMIGFWDMHIALGLLSVTCAILFIIPRTAVFGTILMAGYWGGVIAIELGHGGLQPIVALPAILLISSAWFRTPELFERVLGKR
jgi:hypothetical protein